MTYGSLSAMTSTSVYESTEEIAFPSAELEVRSRRSDNLLGDEGAVDF